MSKNILSLFLCLGVLVLAGCKKDEDKTDEMQPESEISASEEMVEEAAPQEMAKIEISKSFTFFTAENARSGAVFLTLTNSSNVDDALVSASSPAAGIVEIHESYFDDDGTMMMRKVPKVDIPAGKSAVLKPKGLHIMLLQLQEGGIKPGSKIKVTLGFENSEDQTIEVNSYAPGINPFGDVVEDMPMKMDHMQMHEHTMPPAPEAADEVQSEE